MKHKMLAIVIALTAMCWAQTATKSTAANPQQDSASATSAKCPCCDKMAAGEMKCAHHDRQAKDSKDTMPDGKEGMSCMRTKQRATGACCGQDCTKDACSKASSKDKTASCCGDRCNKDGKCCCAGKTGEKTAANCCQRGLRG
jgi:hypothetical protein